MTSVVVTPDNYFTSVVTPDGFVLVESFANNKSSSEGLFDDDYDDYDGCEEVSSDQQIGNNGHRFDQAPKLAVLAPKLAVLAATIGVSNPFTGYQIFPGAFYSDHA